MFICTNKPAREANTNASSAVVDFLAGIDKMHCFHTGAGISAFFINVFKITLNVMERIETFLLLSCLYFH